MHFTILTLFPEMFVAPFAYSIIKRAVEKQQISIDYVNIRDFSEDSYKSVDDRPYGGGIGMVMRVDILDKAIEHAKKLHIDVKSVTILLDPRGTTYTQKTAHSLSRTYEHIILVCGHYEGVDERIRSLVDQQISIGDYVVTGGEIPAMMIVDSITRLLPGVIAQESPKNESFQQGLEYPQYTRPPEYKGMKVPDILVSGNHKKIEDWKQEKSNELTKELRPDLMKPSYAKATAGEVGNPPTLKLRRAR
jgi:tRNA (guanine37-N1)-methyltransferase